MKRQLQVPTMPNFGAAAPAAFFVLVMAILPRQIAAEFEPPRIIEVTNPSDWGIDQASADQRLYVIDKGIESNMNKGDIVSVYRERRFAFKTAAPLRIFIGEITIIESHQGTSIGRFTVNDGALEDPVVRVKVAMEGDFLVPRLILDSSLLFDSGSAALKAGIIGEFENVANFIKFQTPSKLIEGHTDSDGDEDYNNNLSLQRAGAVREMLISEYEFITPDMLEAKGYGEERPLYDNDTDENKSLNRRIEFVIWWEDLVERVDVEVEEEEEEVQQ